MGQYKYSVIDINGKLDDKYSLEKLAKHLNLKGNEGYRLCAVIPQQHEGTTNSNILIFECEEQNEGNTIGG